MGMGRFFRPHLAWTADRPRPDPRPAPDADRFRATILPHLDSAYTLARYLLRDPVAAEDVVQDAFVRALQSFDGFRGDNPRAWLLAIVRNVAFDHGGRAARGDHDELDPEAPSDRPDPEAIVAADSDAALLRATLASLPEPFREALVLRELEELSYKEIAVLTNVPIGTVMSRLARARQMLAALLLPDAENREARR